MKKLIFLSLFLSYSLALQLDQIQNTMQENIQKSLTLLKTTQDKKVVADEIFKLFDSIMDYELMAKLSLSKYYKGLNKEEQDQYEKAFEASLKRSFSDKLSLYKDYILEVKKGELKNENRYFLTSSMLVDGEEKIIVFKFYNKNQDWLIYDVDVLGVSIIQTYRSQFSDILENADFQTLIQKLDNITIQ